MSRSLRSTEGGPRIPPRSFGAGGLGPHFSYFFRIFGVCCRFFGASSPQVAFGDDFLRFLVDFWSILEGFGNDFWTIVRLTLESCDFMKNRVSPWKNQYFFKVGGPKIDKKSMKNLLKKEAN